LTETLDRLLVALADRYTLERELGRGGMATVYLAQDLRHRRQVALKVLHSELGPERFLREIELTAAITPWGADLAQRYPEQYMMALKASTCGPSDWIPVATPRWPSGPRRTAARTTGRR
jgi:hypothetical protein